MRLSCAHNCAVMKKTENCPMSMIINLAILDSSQNDLCCTRLNLIWQDRWHGNLNDNINGELKNRLSKWANRQVVGWVLTYQVWEFGDFFLTASQLTRCRRYRQDFDLFGKNGKFVFYHGADIE